MCVEIGVLPFFGFRNICPVFVSDTHTRSCATDGMGHGRFAWVARTSAFLLRCALLDDAFWVASSLCRSSNASSSNARASC